MAGSQTSQERLLALAAQGNKRAFALLYEQHLEQVYRYVYYRIGDQMEAEDITENCFLKAWEHLPQVYAQGAQIDNFRAWLYRIAHNLVADHYRAKRPVSLQDDWADRQAHPEQVADFRFASRRLAGAIQELEPRLQDVLIHRFVNQLSHQETADLMGLKVGHVRVLQYRALKKLRGVLGEEEL